MGMTNININTNINEDNIYNYQILYKPEDVRKDMIIINIIRLMDIILKKEGLDLHIITSGTPYSLTATNRKSFMIYGCFYRFTYDMRLLKDL